MLKGSYRIGGQTQGCLISAGRREHSQRDPTPVFRLPSLTGPLGDRLESHHAPAPHLPAQKSREYHNHMALINADGPHRRRLSLICVRLSFFILYSFSWDLGVLCK